MTPLPAKQARISTGISGLDEILLGGYPKNRFYLVEGDPGTGKTTLGLQFLLEGRRQGEAGLYVTLSESKIELEDVAASHGWSLEGIEIFELRSAEALAAGGDDYTVFHPADVELTETTQRIFKQVDRLKPTRIVFDSLSEMRLLARDPLRYRRQILGLKQFFTGRQGTVLLLDDCTDETEGSQLQSISHGVIRLERRGTEYGVARRRLGVVKMRGTAFSGGYHDITIETGGMVVYPRLNPTQKQPGQDFSDRQMSSGIGELDHLLGGGIDLGTSTLVVGPAGTGKSSFVGIYIWQAAQRGEHAACYLFEESIQTFLNRCRGIGMDMAPYVEKGLIHLTQIDPAEISPGEFMHRVRTNVEQHHPRVIVVDSLNGYLNAMPSERFLIIQMHELLTYLSAHGILTFLVLAQNGLVGAAMAGPLDVSYLADTIVLMRYFEAFGEVKQAISVLKKRRSSHERSLREFSLTPEGIQIGPELRQFQGVLTGVPSYVGGSEKLIGEPPK